MKTNKIFKGLFFGINIIFLILIFEVFGGVELFFDFLPFEMGFFPILGIVFVLFLYTCGFIKAKRKHEKREKWSFFKKIKQDKKDLKIEKSMVLGVGIIFSIFAVFYMIFTHWTSIVFVGPILLLTWSIVLVYMKRIKENAKNVTEGFDVDDRLLLIGSWILLFIICLLHSLQLAVLLLLLLIFYSIIVSIVIDLIKYKEMKWSFKDCFAGILVLLFLISSAVIFVINYNFIGEAGMFNEPPFYAAIYYLEASIVPWIIFSLYTFIRIKVAKAKIIAEDS